MRASFNTTFLGSIGPMRNPSDPPDADEGGGGTPESDALILNTAAGVLRRRYGVLVAGDLITALQDRAASIRKELAE